MSLHNSQRRHQFLICALSCITLGLSACGSSGTDTPQTAISSEATDTTLDSSQEETSGETEGNVTTTSGAVAGAWVNGFFLKESTRYDAQGIATSTVRYTLNLDEDRLFKEEMSLNDADGAEGFSETTTITYNDAGNRVQENRVDEAGVTSALITNVYNDQGGLVKRVWEYDTNNTFSETFSYDDNGHLIKRETTDITTGEVQRTTNYILRDDGQPASNVTHFVGGSTASTTLYDLQDRKIGYTSEGDSFDEEYVYDENGNIVTQNVYDNDGALFSTRVSTYEATDENVYNSTLWSIHFYR